MDYEDFIETIDNQVVTRADNNMWCQSHNMLLSDVSDLSLTIATTSDMMSSKFIFHIKITIPDGYLIYEYRFNDNKSHTFRQSGGKTWSNAYDTIGSPRMLKLGADNVIRIYKDNQDWLLAINGFKYIKIKSIYKPTDMILSFAYPIGNFTLNKSKSYITDFVRIKSIFKVSLLNNNDFQPRYIRCYLLNLNSNDSFNLKVGNALQFNTIKSTQDLNIREEEVEKSKPVNTSPTQSDDNNTPTKTSSKLEAQSDKSEMSNVIDLNKSDVMLETSTKPIEDIEQNMLAKSKIKGVERYKLTNSEIELLFKKLVDHYIKKGFDEYQAELIIFQMGISFCTSKNSIGDLTSNLIWERSDGKTIRLRKSDHVKFLYNLCKVNCNLERVILKYYSEKILRLLKNGQLIPAVHHANRRGIKSEFAYLFSDFFDYSKLKLSDQELQVLNSDMQYISLKTKHRRSIVNVNQLF
uniref:Minor coat protein n=1 Tax=croton golden spot associated virus C TaxID=3072822 RepID=A0AA50E3U9_9CLOS|nr:minor coat protein [croton golden spot associated virus C]